MPSTGPSDRLTHALQVGHTRSTHRAKSAGLAGAALPISPPVRPTSREPARNWERHNWNDPQPDWQPHQQWMQQVSNWEADTDYYRENRSTWQNADRQWTEPPALTQAERDYAADRGTWEWERSAYSTRATGGQRTQRERHDTGPYHDRPSSATLVPAQQSAPAHKGSWVNYDADEEELYQFERQQRRERQAREDGQPLVRQPPSHKRTDLTVDEQEAWDDGVQILYTTTSWRRRKLEVEDYIPNSENYEDYAPLAADRIHGDVDRLLYIRRGTNNMERAERQLIWDNVINPAYNRRQQRSTASGSASSWHG
jgi:hypothetical protein